MNIKKIIKNNLKKILLIFSSAILLLLIVGLLHDKLTFFDNGIYNFIIQIKSPFFTLFFKFITFYASIEWFIILGVFLFLFYKNKKLNIVILIYILGIALVTWIMKNVFIRVRPIDLMIIEELGYSFPSGHSSTSLAFYGLISYLIYKSNFKKYQKLIIISSLLVLSFFIGVSRIYLGVHYPSDVLAGFMVGIIYFVVFIYIYNIEGRKK